MNINDPEDDFFGVEYLANTDSSEKLHSNKKKFSHKTGTDFVDEAFFPELKEIYNENEASPKLQSRKITNSNTGSDFMNSAFFPELVHLENLENKDNKIDSAHRYPKSQRFQNSKTQKAYSNPSQNLNPYENSRFKVSTNESQRNSSFQTTNKKNLTRYSPDFKTNKFQNRMQDRRDSSNEEDYSKHKKLQTNESVRTSSRYSNNKDDDEEIAIPIAKSTNDEIKGEHLLWEMIDPVWKLSHEELVKYMTKRVIYEDDDLIAFDKPYQLAYSGGTAINLVHLLQAIKKIVAPKSDRLNLIKPLDKAVTGPVLFTKNNKSQIKFKEALKEGQFEMTYRCLVKGIPKLPEAKIKMPLKKFTDGNDIELRPFIEGAKKNWVYDTETEYKILNSDRGSNASLLGVKVTQEIPHQIRSHLGYGIRCPLIGDPKYAKKFPIRDKHSPPTMPSSQFLQKMNVINYHRLPMYMHLKELKISSKSSSKYITIEAPMPKFFLYTLKQLALLKK